MLQRFFSSRVAVSRVVSYKPSKFIPKPFFNKKKVDKPDSYDICIKAKAIARSSGATSALSFALNQLPSSSTSSSIQKSSRPVLINTILTALSREGQSEKFWEVFEAKVVGDKANWSPQLTATVLNQIAKEMEQTRNDGIELLMLKASQVYTEALEIVTIPDHLHIHNAYLKCISRYQNVSYLIWILNQISGNKFRDIDLKMLGVREYMPINEISLKIAKTLTEYLKKPVELDCQSLTSILFTLTRSPEGSIQLAESIWSKFPENSLDKPCHLALLLVYRNDLSRIFNQRKLIRATSWREKKHDRVLQLLQFITDNAGLSSSTDHKLLSIYFEICLNAKLKEKAVAFLEKNPVETLDPRLLELIKKAQRRN